MSDNGRTRKSIKKKMSDSEKTNESIKKKMSDNRRTRRSVKITFSEAVASRVPDGSKAKAARGLSWAATVILLTRLSVSKT